MINQQILNLNEPLVYASCIFLFIVSAVGLYILVREAIERCAESKHFANKKQ